MAEPTTCPFALGLLTTTPGTPRRITDLFPAFVTDGGGLKCNTIEIRAEDLNAGLIYIGTEGMDKATGVKVLRVLDEKETVKFKCDVAGNPFDATQIFFDSAVLTDGIRAWTVTV